MRDLPRPVRSSVEKRYLSPSAPSCVGKSQVTTHRNWRIEAIYLYLSHKTKLTSGDKAQGVWSVWVSLCQGLWVCVCIQTLPCSSCLSSRQRGPDVRYTGFAAYNLFSDHHYHHLLWRFSLSYCIIAKGLIPPPPWSRLKTLFDGLWRRNLIDTFKTPLKEWYVPTLSNMRRSQFSLIQQKYSVHWHKSLYRPSWFIDDEWQWLCSEDFSSNRTMSEIQIRHISMLR